MIPTIGYRRDITGLRAWAVGLVLLYHFQVPPFSGGFVGVDVFFVISGYLMTSIIVGGLHAGRFSLGRFYLSRAARIVPALAVLCLVLLLAGWAWLSAFEYRLLGQQAAASLGFVSNLLFLSEAGYFDVASTEKWLLHTWSLSVEAQFYLLYPLLLMLVWKFTRLRRQLLGWLVWLLVISLLACALISPVQPHVAFFQLPTRAWQLLAGGVVLLLQERVALAPARQRLLSLTGLALIAAAGLWMDHSLAWPGLWALVPVAGAVLILASPQGGTLATGHPAIQWLGLRSYSVYLWHWPVMVAMRFLQVSLDWKAVVIGIILSLVLGEISYRLIETLPRRVSSRARPALVAALLAPTLFFGGWVVAMEGVQGRMPPMVEAAAREASNRNSGAQRCESPEGSPGTRCHFGTGATRAILIGDSHAQAVASAVAQAAPGGAIESWTYPSCATIFAAKPVSGVFRSGQRCPEFNQWVQRTLASVPGHVPVILVSRTSSYLDGRTEPGQVHSTGPAVAFEGTPWQPAAGYEARFSRELVQSACRLARDRPVFLVRPIPEMPVDVPRAVSRALAAGRSTFPTLSLDAYQARNRVVLQAQATASAVCGARILDPTITLCPSGLCQSVEGARPLYYDGDHLSEFGNKRLVPMFRQVFGPSAP